MCRIPKVLIVAPEDMHLDLRRKLSSLEYDIAATVTPDQSDGVTADVAVAWEPDSALVRALRERGLKVVAVGGPNAAGGAEGADLTLSPAEISSFPTRLWELFRAR
jgi:hypothetical protein